MARVFQLGDLARAVGGRVVGDPHVELRGVATLEQAADDELSFLTNPRYRAAARTSRAAAILVGAGKRIAGRHLLECAEPYVALARVLELFHPAAPRRAAISERAAIAADARLGAEVDVGPFAVIESGAVIGESVTIGAGCVVGSGSQIGEASTLMPGVVLYPGTLIGQRCLIHAGVVLGADGFGFATSQGVHHKIPQLGRVVLGDDVEVGANTTVDRAMLGETVIGEGTKIDDLVMLAHGVRVGPRGLLAAQSGVAGSARLGKQVTLAGQSGVAGHLHVGDGAIVAAKSAVFDDVEPGAFRAGVPAIDHRRWKRSQALIARLPELRRELRALRREVAEREED